MFYDFIIYKRKMPRPNTTEDQPDANNAEESPSTSAQQTDIPEQGSTTEAPPPEEVREPMLADTLGGQLLLAYTKVVTAAVDNMEDYYTRHIKKDEQTNPKAAEEEPASSKKGEAEALGCKIKDSIEVMKQSKKLRNSQEAEGTCAPKTKQWATPKRRSRTLPRRMSSAGKRSAAAQKRKHSAPRAGNSTGRRRRRYVEPEESDSTTDESEEELVEVKRPKRGRPAKRRQRREPLKNRRRSRKRFQEETEEEQADDEEQEDDVEGVGEELVVEYVYPTYKPRVPPSRCYMAQVVDSTKRLPKRKTRRPRSSRRRSCCTRGYRTEAESDFEEVPAKCRKFSQSTTNHRRYHRDESDSDEEPPRGRRPKWYY